MFDKNWVLYICLFIVGYMSYSLIEGHSEVDIDRIKQDITNTNAYTQDRIKQCDLLYPSDHSKFWQFKNNVITGNCYRMHNPPPNLNATCGHDGVCSNPKYTTKETCEENNGTWKLNGNPCIPCTYVTGKYDNEWYGELNGKSVIECGHPDLKPGRSRAGEKCCS